MPSAPTGFSVSAQNGAWGVALSWTASSTPNVTYNLYRGVTSGGQASTPVASGLTSSSYSDAGLSADTAYFYTVKAVRNNVASAASGEATARRSDQSFGCVGSSQITLSCRVALKAAGLIRQVCIDDISVDDAIKTSASKPKSKPKVKTKNPELKEHVARKRAWKTKKTAAKTVATGNTYGN